ncbi:DUF4834 family protein [Christiangramia sp. LLG6405-1]|uniref:DUF4834 family protein n=1 Tax=Christiangramia sp. LLG6405-1 TaxID=3160832 RepID=UPI00386D73AE
MLEASLSGVLKFVLLVLLIYFGFKIIIRFFGPLILKYFMRKMGEKFEQQFGQQFGNQFGGAASKKSKSNPTNIGKEPKAKPNKDKKVGEYIDYEEID